MLNYHIKASLGNIGLYLQVIPS